MNRNLRSYQVIQHTQLNLLQSSNAISLLITACCTWGCPQLAASGDTLTPCRIIHVFQLQLLWKPFRQRWLVSSTLHFIFALLYFLFVWLVGGLKGQSIVFRNKRSMNCNIIVMFYGFMCNAWQFCADETAGSFHISLQYIYILK